MNKSYFEMIYSNQNGIRNICDIYKDIANRMHRCCWWNWSVPFIHNEMLLSVEVSENKMLVFLIQVQGLPLILYFYLWS